MRFLPKIPCEFEGINLEIFPPGLFVAGLVKFPMVPATERDGEFIADLETDGPRLRKPQMMRIGGLAPAD